MSALETVMEYYHNFNIKNWQGILDLLDENIRHDANQGGTHYGKASFADFQKIMDECYDEELKDITLFSSDAGGRIAAEFTVHGIYKKTDGNLPEAHNQTYVLPAGAFLEVKNGKITRVTTYYNLPLWISLVSA